MPHVSRAIWCLAIAALLAIAVNCFSNRPAQAWDCSGYGDGLDWNSEWLMCAPSAAMNCAANQIYQGDACVTCPGLSVPNGDHTSCGACPAGLHPTSNGRTCVGNGGICNLGNGTISQCYNTQSCERIPHTLNMQDTSLCVQDCKDGMTMADNRVCEPICKDPGTSYLPASSAGPWQCYACLYSGMVSSPDHTECVSCPSGEVPSPSHDYCIKPGTCKWPQIYSVRLGLGNVCRDCPAGQVADESQGSCRVACSGGSIYNPATQSCDTCTGPTVPNAHGTECVRCEQGVASSNHAACVGCAPGKYPNREHNGCVACLGNDRVSGDGMACVTCKKGSWANRAHSACVGPSADIPRPNVLTAPPRVSRPQGDPMNPGIMEGTPGLGGQGPAGIGHPVGGTRPGAAGIR
jgi:hypothetical protein